MLTLGGMLQGSADERLAGVVERLDVALGANPELSIQVAAFHGGRAVLDAWGGPYLSGTSVIVPFSVTKNTIGLVAGLLVQRGLLDLDQAVAHYWPEFGQKGKGGVTVRMLLSHQSGLPQASPPLAWSELLDHHAAAERLAQTRPFWQPGSAFGYHAITIGALADELVFRVTGDTLHAYYEREIRQPHAIDFYLGLPADQAHRLVHVLPPIEPAVVPASPPPPALTSVVMATPGPPVDIANDEASWGFGLPAGSGTGSARGIARLMAAAVTGVEGGAAFLDAETVGIIGQQQVHGFDEVLGHPDRAHSIVFQKPTRDLPFGGPRAFGHDGARGAFASVDPDSGVAFAWTIARGEWPGGGDPRAVALSAELSRLLA